MKSFAAEGREVTKLARAAQRLRWASVAQDDARARYGPLMENLPRLGLAAVLLYGGMAGHRRRGARSARSSPSTPTSCCCRRRSASSSTRAHAGPAGAASAERIFEILDERPTVVDRPGAVDLVDLGRVGSSSTTCASRYARRATPVLDRFSLRRRARRDRRPRRPHRQRQVDGGPPAAALLRRHRRRRARSTATTSATSRLTSMRHHVGVVLDEPFLFSETIRANIAYGRPDATDDEVVAAAEAAQADGFIRALPDGYDTVIGERGYDLSGGQRQRIAIARTLLAEPARPRARRRHQRHRRAGRGGHPRGARPTAWPAARRSSSPTGCPPSPSPTGWCCSRAGGSWPRAATPSCWPPSPATPRCWPASRRTTDRRSRRRSDELPVAEAD